MDNKFWKGEEEKLDKSSFVTQQLRKLFNKDEKSVDNIDYAEMIENNSDSSFFWFKSSTQSGHINPLSVSTPPLSEGLLHSQQW